MTADGERAYLDEVRALSFDGRRWTPDAITDMRDFLAPWNHNIRLAPGIHTAYCDDWYPEHRTITETIDRHLGGGYEAKRVLDLGCLEGYFSLECAMHGAEVVGVDAKEINVQKCRFVQSVLDVPNVRFVLDDVLNVNQERYGSFDVVLALGLLYHLNDPFTFLAQIAELCAGFLVLDTLVALEDAPQTIEDWAPELSDLREFPFGGAVYRGRLYREYQEGVTPEERELSTTASHTNDFATWLTEDALITALSDAGLGQLEKVVFPQRASNWWSDPSDGRVLYVARGPGSFSSEIFKR